MKRITLFFLKFLVLSLVSLRAQAADLKVMDVSSAGRGLSIEAALRGATAEKPNFRVKNSAGEAFTVSAKAVPMNLWILVDSSSLCQAFKMDKYLSTLFSKLPGLLSPETLLTVVAYTSDSKTIVAKGVSPAGVADLK